LVGPKKDCYRKSKEEGENTMGVLEAIGLTIGGKVGGTIWETMIQAYDDWREGRSRRLAIAIDPYGAVEMLPEQEGLLIGTVSHEEQFEESIVLRGRFLADDFFAEFADLILEHDEKIVLLVAIDEETGEVLLAAFDFYGYAMALWPGVYSLYAFIIDPILDDFLAIGYPDWGDLQDPNPIELSGSGDLPMDFVLFDVDEDYDA
jgi:hypothetical protein